MEQLAVDLKVLNTGSLVDLCILFVANRRECKRVVIYTNVRTKGPRGRVVVRKESS